MDAISGIQIKLLTGRTKFSQLVPTFGMRKIKRNSIDMRLNLFIIYRSVSV